MPVERIRAAPGATEKLMQALRGKAVVKRPDEADEPILAPAVRSALFAWLAEIRAEDELKQAGLRPRSTALFYGPPGCGKTTMAHHLAARLGVPMVMVGPENIISSGWGEAEKRLAYLFNVLEELELPCVLFIDEFESLGGNRGQNTHGGADNARTSLLGVMLRRIESYRGFAVAATNRQQDIDPAMWRRFHLQVEIALPGPDERFAILRRYGAPFGFADDDLDLLSALTDGASPALLRGLMETLKRFLVIGARIGLPVGDPVALFRRVMASTQPPPDDLRPPLWVAGADLSQLAGLSWPPLRSAA